MRTQTQSVTLPSSDEVEAIPATEMKNAHGKRLPAILKKNGIARVTRYNQTDYFVVSPALFDALKKQATRPENTKLCALKTQYRKLVDRMQTPENQNAFRALSLASNSELGATTKVGASD